MKLSFSDYLDKSTDLFPNILILKIYLHERKRQKLISTDITQTNENDVIRPQLMLLRPVVSIPFTFFFFGDKFLNKTPIFNLKKVKDIKTVFFFCFFSKTKCRSHSVNECFIKHFATRINQVSFSSIIHELFCILF